MILVLLTVVQEAGSRTTPWWSYLIAVAICLVLLFLGARQLLNWLLAFPWFHEGPEEKYEPPEVRIPSNPHGGEMFAGTTFLLAAPEQLQPWPTWASLAVIAGLLIVAWVGNKIADRIGRSTPPKKG